MTEPISARFRGRLLLVLPIALLGLGAPSSVAAQDGGDSGNDANGGGSDWNDARTLGVVREAIDARRHGRDNDLERFSAYAEGEVHYVAEYGDQLRDQIIRSDRVALELRWRRGVGSLQTIVGRRHVSWMPTTVRYHIDHLSLVVENFGDRIHIGDGDEVRDVLNPVAPGALSFYEYRLVDSLSLLVNDRLTELYRLEVRPVHPDSSGVVGTLDLERESLAVVRLAVTFTPSSYVDPTVRSVSVDLQNALISNRVWLPAEQRTEVRRQLRFLEMPFGGTIRSSFKVLSWNLSPSRDVWIPVGHRVRAVPEYDQERYVGWQTWDPDGAPELMRADSAVFDGIRTEAVRVVRGRYLGGASRLRLHVPSVSSLIRVRRAEGVFAGLGARYDLDGHWSATLHGGYAFGAEQPQLSGRIAATYGSVRFGVDGWLDRSTDIGPWTAAAGLVSTGGALLGGEDYLDPFHTSGGRAWVSLPVAGGAASVALAAGDHESAELHLNPLSDADPRPVMPIQEGWDTRIEVGWDRVLGSAAGSRLFADADIDLATFGTFDYSRWVLEVIALPSEPDAVWAWEGRGGFGLVTGNEPVQRTLRIGGRGTVPGYESRRFSGEQVAFVNFALSRRVLYPWLRVRALGALGWSHIGDAVVGLRHATSGELLDWQTPDTGGLRPSVGGGVSIVYDLVRLDVARGLDDGVWEWMLSVNPQFWSPL